MARKFLFVDQNIIDKINRRRGRSTQGEFIKNCIENYLGEEESKVTRRSPVKIWKGSGNIKRESVKREIAKPASDKSSFMFMDQDLLERIDENRGPVSRTEFIEQCISSRVPKVVVSEPKHYATREEFQEFRGFVKNTLKDLADMLFHTDVSSKFDKYLDAPYRPRRERAETLEYEDTRRPVASPRTGSREYYEDDYMSPPRRVPQRPPQRPSERRYAEDREREQSRKPRERTEIYPSDERRETADYPPPAREQQRYPRESEYQPPRPPRQDVPPASTGDGVNLRGMLNGLKVRLQNWLFTQEEPVPAAGVTYPPTPTQTRYNEYDTTHRDVSRQEISRYDVTRHETVIHDAPPVMEIEEEDTGSQNMHPGLWGLAILLFGFGDTLLSTMVFAKGGYEANPLMGGLVSFFGGSIVAFVIIKTIIMGVLALISFKVFKNQGWLIPSILIVVGAFLVLSNLMAYVKL